MQSPKNKRKYIEVIGVKGPQARSASVQPPLRSEGSGGQVFPSVQPPAAIPKTDEDPVIGDTVEFESYSIFQHTEATATDLESLVMLERSIAKGERRTGQSRIMTYIMALFVGVIILIIFLSIAPGLLKGFGI